MLNVYKFYVKPILNQGKGHAMNCLWRFNAGASCKLKAEGWNCSCKLEATALQAANENSSWK